MVSPAALELYQQRECGNARNGSVYLRDFDQGVVETFGAKVVPTGDGCPGERNGMYYLLNVPGITDTAGPYDPGPNIDAPPDLPGVPVIFANPEDTWEPYVLPMVLITRQDISPAMNRFQPGSLQYRVPARGALPVEVSHFTQVKQGWNKMEQRMSAVPWDISYTIQVMAYRRGNTPGDNIRTPVKAHANALLHYVLHWYQPYTSIHVHDTVGDERIYLATVDSVSPLDSVDGIGQRLIGWELSMVVEGELDLNAPQDAFTATDIVASYKQI